MLPWQEPRCLPNSSTSPIRGKGRLRTHRQLTSQLLDKARRCEKRHEGALERAGDDEEREGRGCTAECGCAGESAETGDEGGFAAEEDRDSAAEQEQAKAREHAVTTHCRSPLEKPRAVWADGRAISRWSRPGQP